jgi:hypothetical protein
MSSLVKKGGHRCILLYHLIIASRKAKVANSTLFFYCPIALALLNAAFINGDMSWHQVWLRNRMRVVESAENMSYNIPGTKSIPRLSVKQR